MNFSLFPPHMSCNEEKYIKRTFDQNFFAPLGPNVDASVNPIVYLGATLVLVDSEPEGLSLLEEPEERYFSNRWLTTILIDPVKTGKTREDLYQRIAILYTIL